MQRVDPTTIRLAVGAAPRPGSAPGLLAALLQRAPNYLLAAAIHGLGIVLAWSLVSPELPELEVVRIELQLAEATTSVAPPLPSLPPLRAEVLTETPMLQAPDLADSSPPDAGVYAPLPPSLPRTPGLDQEQWRRALSHANTGSSRYSNRASNHVDTTAAGHSALRALDNALAWLQKHQDDDGRFDCDNFMKHDTEGESCDGSGNTAHDVGVTGLALLAFLGNGSTMRGGRHQDAIKRSVGWLRAQQQSNGLFGTNTAQDFIYDHAIATYAMCEAYGLSQYMLLKGNAQLGLDFLAAHRRPDGVWSYQPRGGSGDTSVTGWCLLAVESGRSFGLQVDAEAERRCQQWFDQVTERNGRAGYTMRGEVSSRRVGDHGLRFPPARGEALTAVSLLCRHLLGQDPREVPAMAAAAELILGKPPVWDPQAGSIDEYYWFYGAHALYQQGERQWQEWSRRLLEAVLPNQRDKGNFLGSWDPIGVWGEDGGRVYSTAMLALCLQAGWRYTRLHH